MTTEKELELTQILESDFFNQIFDFASEEMEIKSAGWDYNELNQFGKQLSKKIK